MQNFDDICPEDFIDYIDITSDEQEVIDQTIHMQRMMTAKMSVNLLMAKPIIIDTPCSADTSQLINNITEGGIVVASPSGFMLHDPHMRPAESGKTWYALSERDLMYPDNFEDSVKCNRDSKPLFGLDPNDVFRKGRKKW